MAERLTSCRFCQQPLRTEVLDLGTTPVANALVAPDHAPPTDPSYPLRVMLCDSCYLVQHDAVIDPATIFSGDYVYFSSVSQKFVEHAKRYVDDMVARFDLGSAHRVVEIGSNDGYLLQHFRPHGVATLGIEPSGSVAEAARAKGVPTETRFFNLETADWVVATGQTADLVAANNVLAHIPAIDEVYHGVRRILRPGGVFTVEFPHLLTLVENNEFDTIYHEHYFYYSLLAIDKIFERTGLRLFDVETLDTHGGSLRIFACRDDDPRPAVAERLELLRAAERDAALDDARGYTGLAARVQAAKDGFRHFLEQARRDGKRVAAFGAAAKGNTFLNTCGITAADIPFIVDETPAKIGKLLPGSRIPVVEMDVLERERPDYVVILPWNHRHEIVRKLAFMQAWGGACVVAIPELEQVDWPADAA